MTRFFTADQHFYHINIIAFAGRPYKNVDKMASSLIGRHNKIVGPEDVVYHLGDFLWIRNRSTASTTVARLLKRMNGRHILILGNHDDLKPFAYVDAGFESVHTSLHLQHLSDGEILDFYLVHDPSAYCVIPDHAYLLHGHVHTLYTHLLYRRQKAINVGVDVWDRTPISMDQIIDLIKKYKQKWARLDEAREKKRENPSPVHPRTETQVIGGE